MSLHCAIPSEVARAIDLDSCARYHAAPTDGDYRLYSVSGHHKHSQFIFSCCAELVPSLVGEIEKAAATATTSHFRETCERAIATLREEVAREANPSAFPPRPVAPAFGPNSMGR